MPLVIASQLEPGINARLAQHPAGPLILDVPEDAPWGIAGQADVLIVRPSPAWRASPARPAAWLWPGRLRWVYSASVGVDFYPPWLLDAPLVSCGRGVASDEIADYVIAAIFSRAKNLERVTVRSRADWQPAALGRIAGATIGIIGNGAIGRAVAARATALGAQVVATRRRAGVEDGIRLLDSIAAVIAISDHIVLASPATRETRGLINADLLKQAKPGAHLINVARGAVVDQDALIAALDAGPLDFATLDVTEPEPLPEGHPLYTHPKVWLTPHVSSNYLLVRDRLVDKILDDITRLARGDAPSDLVDPALDY